MNNKTRVTRKDFFSGYFHDLCSGIEEAFTDELSRFSENFPELIRPPGALPEKEFLETCSRCGACVRACQFHALAPVLVANEFDRGTPMLREGQSYCRFCAEFPCVAACPSGALTKNEPGLHRLGNARVRETACLRSEGKDCHSCSDICAPIAAAITITPGNPAKIDAGSCSGCGACVTVCPAYPDLAIKLFR